MTPVIRIDDDVMEALKRHAVRLGLVFESPNTTLRALLNLDQTNKADVETPGNPGLPNTTLKTLLSLDRTPRADDKTMGNPEPPVLKRSYESARDVGTGYLKSLEIVLHHVHSAYEWALIPIPTDRRAFFPGYKVEFELVTNVGSIMTHVTSAPKGTPHGDPLAGRYIQTGLGEWFHNHSTLRDGSRLRFDMLEQGKRYKLSEVED